MRIPCSVKTILRLHRKLFTLRTPRSPSRTAWSVALSGDRDGHSPLVQLRVEKNRTPVLGIALAVAALVLATAPFLREK